MLDDLGLIAAVEWQAREISRRCDVEVEVQAQEFSSKLNEPLKVCIYRVVSGSVEQRRTSFGSPPCLGRY